MSLFQFKDCLAYGFIVSNACVCVRMYLSFVMFALPAVLVFPGLQVWTFGSFELS